MYVIRIKHLDGKWHRPWALTVWLPISKEWEEPILKTEEEARAKAREAYPDVADEDVAIVDASR